MIFFLDLASSKLCEKLHPKMAPGHSLGRGTLTDRHAGVVTELAAHASKLSGDASDVPVICLESEAGNILIRRQDDLTVALHKMPS
uniref:Ragulator complex protein LAMTOR5 n=1 Tax=Eptatretus burgeri TaxID=7764 RepID=A0A8C4R2R2_EPTBU